MNCMILLSVGEKNQRIFHQQSPFHMNLFVQAQNKKRYLHQHIYSSSYTFSGFVQFAFLQFITYYLYMPSPLQPRGKLCYIHVNIPTRTEQNKQELLLLVRKRSKKRQTYGAETQQHFSKNSIKSLWGCDYNAQKFYLTGSNFYTNSATRCTLLWSLNA